MKRRHSLSIELALILLAGATAVASTTSTAKPPSNIVKTSTLPTVGLAEFQERLLLPAAPYTAIPVPPWNTEPDRTVDLGGIGSDLYRQPGVSTNEFWMITDRGPNGELDSGERTFPVPWFDPTILHVRASGPEMKIVDALPLVGGPNCDTPVGGLPNLGVTSPVADATPFVYDDPPYAYDGRQPPFLYSQSGLDTEGLVRTANGEFWFAEEYSPSIGRIDTRGCIRERIVPNGLPLIDTGYPVVSGAEGVPAIYQLRKKNRGFEALGLSPSGRYLFVGHQSPLLNPTTSAGNAASNTRILRYDLHDQVFGAEYVYRFQPASNGMVAPS